MENTFTGKRLTDKNIVEYFKTVYNATTVKRTSHRQIGGFPILKQNDYGEANDCTITCMTACISFKAKSKNYKSIYSIVEKYGKLNGYTGTDGTNPLRIKKIYDASMQEVTGESVSTIGRYMKDIGYNLKTIVNAINSGVPVILSVLNDGRDYYKNHSITVIGYNIYSVDGKQYYTLIVTDNWYSTVSLLDYTKLPAISSVNY